MGSYFTLVLYVNLHFFLSHSEIVQIILQMEKSADPAVVDGSSSTKMATAPREIVPKSRLFIFLFLFSVKYWKY